MIIKAAQKMKELRKRRKDAGLVEFRIWVKPEGKEYLDNKIPLLKKRKWTE